MSQRYRTIVADPPWPMPETGQRTPAPRDAEGMYESKSGREVDGAWWATFTGKTVKLPYETMSLDDIVKLRINGERVGSIVDNSGAHLYLWTTNRFVVDAYEVAEEWGFRPSQLLTWAKPPMGLGFGGAFSSTTEFCLFARRGKLAPLQREDSTWWNWSRPYEHGHIAHSAKPEAFLDMVERVSPAPRLELFARRNRLGWDTWGNESLEHISLGVEGQG